MEARTNDLRSRGLCLVPVSCTEHVANSNGADLWSPAMGCSNSSSSSSSSRRQATLSSLPSVSSWLQRLFLVFVYFLFCVTLLGSAPALGCCFLVVFWCQGTVTEEKKVHPSKKQKEGRKLQENRREYGSVDCYNLEEKYTVPEQNIYINACFGIKWISITISTCIICSSLFFKVTK